VRLRKTPEMLGFRAVDTLGTIVAALFATWIPLSIYSVFLALDQRRLVQKFGANVPFAQQNSLDGRFGMVHAFAAVLALIVGPLFLVWFARAYCNLPTISPGPTRSRTTVATIMWFVPLLLFIRPLGYLREIWARTDRVDKKKPAPPTLIVAYWISFLALEVLQVLIVFRALSDNKTPEELRLAADLNVLWAANGVVCATLIGLIVWLVTRRMTSRCAEVTNAILNAPQFP